jgi:hypothetical protein
LLADEAKSKAAASSAAGEALAARTLNGDNQKLSTWQLKANHESAVKMENGAAELRAGADALNAAKDTVLAARAAVGAEEVARAAKAAAEGEEVAAGGALTEAMKEILKVQPHQRAALLERDTCWA